LKTHEQIHIEMQLEVRPFNDVELSVESTNNLNYQNGRVLDERLASVKSRLLRLANNSREMHSTVN